MVLPKPAPGSQAERPRRTQAEDIGPWLPEEARELAPAVAEAKAALDALDADEAADDDGKATTARAQLTALDAHLEGHPDDADALLWRSRAHVLAGDATAAEADLLASVELDGKYLATRQALCDLLVPRGRCEDAMPHLDALVLALPEASPPLANRAFCKLRASDPEGALVDAKAACAMGHAVACDGVTRIEGRMDWLAKKEKERAAAEAAVGETSEGGSGEAE